MIKPYPKHQLAAARAAFEKLFRGSGYCFLWEGNGYRDTQTENAFMFFHEGFLKGDEYRVEQRKNIFTRPLKDIPNTRGRAGSGSETLG